MAPKLSHFHVCFSLLLVLHLSIAHSRTLKANDGHPLNSFQSLEGSQKGQTLLGLKEVKSYLKRFGYYPNDETENVLHTDSFDDLLENALKTYQKNFGLQVTGVLDSNTIKKIMTPRCGVPDFVHHNHSKHDTKFGNFTVSLYSFNGGTWPPQSQLTYGFQSSVQEFDEQVLKSVCANAFKRWADVTDFTFQEVQEGAQPNIVIGFHRGEHGDGAAFDGPSGVLAHSFPPRDGRFHIDADESWSTNPSMEEMDLESVAVHEIGHILGLGHSPDHPEAIMYPAIPPGTIKRDLTSDDIAGIQALYSN